MSAVKFWETKTLDEMTRDEWESLCDGCGQCCLIKLEDEDTSDVYMTRLSCKLLDTHTCQCKDYANRHATVPDCVVIKPETVRTLPWLPQSCAYRLLAEGKPLEWWHPLVSGQRESVHEGGASVQGFARSEEGVPEALIARYIIGTV